MIGDVKDRSCLIVDDMITTGRTIEAAAAALVRAGARPAPLVAATHAVLLPGADQLLAGAGVVELVVTDSVPQARSTAPPVTVTSVAPLLASAIRGIADPLRR